jgi:hypothetical protein
MNTRPPENALIAMALLTAICIAAILLTELLVKIFR